MTGAGASLASEVVQLSSLTLVQGFMERTQAEAADAALTGLPTETGNGVLLVIVARPVIHAVAFVGIDQSQAKRLP